MKELTIGQSVKLVGKHPWSGHQGIVVRYGQTPFGEYPVVRLTDIGYEHECFVMNSNQVIAIGVPA